MLTSKSMCDELSGPEEPKGPAGQKLRRERICNAEPGTAPILKTGRSVESLCEKQLDAYSPSPSSQGAGLPVLGVETEAHEAHKTGWPGAELTFRPQTES